MLSRQLYEIGKTYNLITKYNIEYDRRAIIDFICAVFIYELLANSKILSDMDRLKLQAILNNLIMLDTTSKPVEN